MSFCETFLPISNWPGCLEGALAAERDASDPVRAVPGVNAYAAGGSVLFLFCWVSFALAGRMYTCFCCSDSLLFRFCCAPGALAYPTAPLTPRAPSTHRAISPPVRGSVIVVLGLVLCECGVVCGVWCVVCVWGGGCELANW